jgi:biopolymer transport protein ExbD
MALGKVPGGDHGDDDELSSVFAEINITPLTDIFLVLLIIFMVTSTVIVTRDSGSGARQGLKVNLPQGGVSDVNAKESDLSIAILSDGRVVVAGDVVTEQELDTLLKDTQKKDPDTMIIIQADEGVPHGKVVQAMEAAKRVGLSQVAIGVRDQSH